MKNAQSKEQPQKTPLDDRGEGEHEGESNWVTVKKNITKRQNNCAC